MSEDDMMPSRAVPVNFGPLRGAHANARITGPCGDTMEFWLDIQDDHIQKATFTTDGCLHSFLCGSTAATLAEGSDLASATALTPEQVLTQAGPVSEESRHCALLAVKTLLAAIENFTMNKKPAVDDPSHYGHDGPCSDIAIQGKAPAEASEADFALQYRLSHIRHKIMVLSGKGGVGKSTVAVNLAVSLALAGKKVGLLDVDIHGPSIPTMLGLHDSQLQTDEEGMIPARVGDLKVMSIGLLLNHADDPVIWRGPMKMGVIRQFLQDVHWGDLDYLVIDSPPGTGDEPLSVCQLIDHPDGAIVVTTPQDVAAADVRKSVGFCRQLSLPVLGVVENMSGFACPSCGHTTAIFKSGGGQRIALDFGVPFLGAIPIDPAIGTACDDGTPFVQRYAGSETARAFKSVIEPILEQIETGSDHNQTQTKDVEVIMRIAIPIVNGALSAHFGHCETFALIDVDPDTKKILGRQDLQPPPHEPGVLPRWLSEQGVKVIIAGGMGQRALGLFTQQKITVCVGAPALAPEDLVAQYLAGTLETGRNVCDH